MSVKLTLPDEDLSLSLSASLDNALSLLYTTHESASPTLRNAAKVQTDTHAHLWYGVIP